MQSLENLQPVGLWQQFQKICDIPHPSYHEEQVRQYLVTFAKEHKLEHEVDQAGNVIIRKAATAGMENRAGVILQGHMDMVPEKNADVVHDFCKDPIAAYVDGDWVKAKGTTLGADNGIGLAAALAVLVSDTIEHGPVEILATVNEENGMTGAQQVQPGQLKGSILLNLDTEEEGVLYIGCAGGGFLHADAVYAEETLPKEGFVYRTITVNGLKGGHSGCDIHLGRGNAIVLMTRLLRKLEVEGMRLAELGGGLLANAIPREASAVVAIPSDKIEACTKILDTTLSEVANELKAAEPDLRICMDEVAYQGRFLKVEDQSRWLRGLLLCPNGVLRMSDAVPGVVETSCNLGVVLIREGKIKVIALPRSLVDSAFWEVRDRVHALFTMLGAEMDDRDTYPGWQPNAESPLLKQVQETYHTLFDKKAGVKVIHAGLECGLLGSKYPNWDMISMGPTILAAHSPDERINIHSVNCFWQLLLASLKAVPVEK
ncbi:Cytosol non-specific dipeptidase [invertebrate metagenome]|uniref:Cytosol non-specific dipeptidase n=1 Tax=invertebrate metagenome TaxID=1711999 RepID=A0A2H9T799_9ZZZZ